MQFINVILLNIIILFLGFFFLFQYFRKKENRFLINLQEIIDSTMNGNFQTRKVDETKLSALENSLRRYIMDHELSEENQKLQKKKIQEFISDISHQTITPIANIVLYAQLLEEQEENAGEEIRAIREQAEKLDFLINSLVKISRMETGLIQVQCTENKIAKLWEILRNQFVTKAEQKNIQLVFEDTKVRAFFDLKWTGEAIGNIVDNAIKYTGSGGTILISVKAYSFFVRVDVRDNGIGIEEKDLNKIFARFYRAFEVSEESGVGIGLYLAREIIQAQKGYIKVKSQKGEGSVFSIFLPV